MRLLKKREDALHAMIYISINYEKPSMKMREISENEKIPVEFLSQILLQLKKAGLLQSIYSTGEGYSLIKYQGEKICRLQSIMQDFRNPISNILENVNFNNTYKITKNRKES